MTPAEMTAGLAFRLDGPHSDEDTAAVAELAAKAVRFLNYATGSHASSGLTYPATAYAVTGSLGLAASRLGQCFGQVTDFLDRELAAGRLGEDSGCDPVLPVERARRHHARRPVGSSERPGGPAPAHRGATVTAIPIAHRDRPAVPVAEVRLSGELPVCDVLAAILAAFPGVQVTGQSGPRRNRRDPGHRIYLTVRLDLPEGNPS